MEQKVELHILLHKMNTNVWITSKNSIFIPQNNSEEPPKITTDDDPNRLDNNLINIIPENPLQPYDMKEIINSY